MFSIERINFGKLKVWKNNKRKPFLSTLCTSFKTLNGSKQWSRTLNIITMSKVSFLNGKNSPHPFISSGFDKSIFLRIIF